MSKFIGRAELQVYTILTRLLNPRLIKLQVPIYELISLEEYSTLDEEIQKHKFDAVVFRKTKDPLLVVEVNFRHKEKAAKKWRTIFKPLLRKNNHKTLVIHDYECTSLFKPQDYSKHVLCWEDVLDVCNALKTQNIPVN